MSSHLIGGVIVVAMIAVAIAIRKYVRSLKPLLPAIDEHATHFDQVGTFHSESSNAPRHPWENL